MKVALSTLAGPALNWAVALREGKRVKPWHAALRGWLNEHDFSGDCSKGGPIIDREKISTIWRGKALGWWACVGASDSGEETLGCFGPTRLIAAMRAWTATDGEEFVEVPDELVESEAKAIPTIVYDPEVSGSERPPGECADESDDGAVHPTCPRCGSHIFELTVEQQIEVMFAPDDHDVHAGPSGEMAWDKATFAECVRCHHSASLGEMNDATAHA